MQVRLAQEHHHGHVGILRRSHMIVRQRSVRNNSGDTLIEVMITVLIVAIAGVAIAGAFAALIDATVSNKALSTETLILRTYAEDLIKPPEGNSGNSSVSYVACAVPGNYGVPSWFTYGSDSATDGSLMDASTISTSPTLFTGSANYVGSVVTDAQGAIPPDTTITAEDNSMHTATLSNAATACRDKRHPYRYPYCPASRIRCPNRHGGAGLDRFVRTT